MQPASLHELLPLDPAIKKPNAYQIFGLDGEETDHEIVLAVRTTCERLKERQSNCEPKTWQQAARLVTAARQVLEDPQQRAQLDRKLAAERPTPTNETPTATDSAMESADPLAGLLPNSNPLQQSDSSTSATVTSGTTKSTAASVLGLVASPSETASESTDSALGTPPIGTPPTSQAIENPLLKSESPADGVNWAPPKKTRTRRKKSKAGLFAFTAIVVLLLGGIVFLLDRISKGERLAVNENGIPTKVETVSERSAPRKPIARPLGDGVMPPDASGGITPNLGEMAASGSTLAPPGGFEFSDGKTPDVGDAEIPNEIERSSNMPAMNSDIRDPFAMPEENQPSNQDAKSDEMPSPSMKEGEPDAAAMETARKQMEETESLIKTAQWDSMKVSADGLLKLKLTPEQFKRASTLYDIADLATYFRGAIFRGAATLQVGNDFEVVDGFRVIVVEITTTEITVQFNKRQKTHALDKLPPTLAERLASFQLDLESPDAQAGMALFRLIDPTANQDYKDDALKTLEALSGKLEKVDSENLLAVAKELLL